MNIAAEKTELIKQFNEVQDMALIQAIKNLLKPKSPEKKSQLPDTRHSFSYAPEIIEINGKKYILNFPLRCLLVKEEDHFVIKNETLDIFAAGKTTEDAENDFDEEFDNLYKTLNALNEHQLTPRMNNIKKFINLYVNHVV